MIGAATSVSFKKSGRAGLLRPLTTLPPFVPRLFIEDISLNHDKYKGFDAAGRDLTAASKTLKPSIIELQAALMIADVTGFTKLTEILSKKGTSGVELLTTCMNNYFTRVINMIMSFDGDVIKFAGDSMIVLFYPNEGERRHPDKGLKACTNRMAHCAWQLATKLGHMRMKLNGQVEPVSAAEAAGATAGAAAAAGVPITPGAVPEVEATEQGGGDLLRHNSGPGTGAPPLRKRDSPRSGSTTNLAQKADDYGSPAQGSDAAPGSDRQASIQGEKASRGRGKSWALLNNILKTGKAVRKSEAVQSGANTPSSMSTVGRNSIDRSDTKSSRAAALRERARTETGLGLRASMGGGATAGLDGASSGTASGAGSGLWATGDSVVRREMSVASKLQIPPPLRTGLQQRASGALSPLHTAAGPHTVAGSHQPSSSTLGSNSGSLAMQSPRSFTERSADSGGFGVAAAAGGNSASGSGAGGRRGRVQSTLSERARVAPPGDWRSKLQSMGAAVTSGSGPMPKLDDELLPQRSRLSESARAVRWDTVREEDPRSSGPGTHSGVTRGGTRSEDEDDEDEDDASYPPLPAGSAVPRGSGGDGDDSGVRGSTSTSTEPRSSNGSSGQGQTPGHSRSDQRSRDLRKSLLQRQGYVGDENSQRRDATSDPGQPSSSQGQGQHRTSTGDLGDLSGPGPVAEAIEGGPRPSMSKDGYAYTPAGGAHHASMTGHMPDGPDGNGNTFMHKVVHWFSANARKGSPGQVDSFSHLQQARESEEADAASQHSQDPTQQSFNYTTGMGGTMGGRSLGPVGGMSKAPRGDPLMEEVSQARLSLKVMVSAGSVCVFHVGGGVDEVVDPRLPEIPRWEFFIGDRPLAPKLDSNGRRRCVAQISEIEDHATAGTVVASHEAMDIMGAENWDTSPLPDNVSRVNGPATIRPPAASTGGMAGAAPTGQNVSFVQLQGHILGMNQGGLPSSAPSGPRLDVRARASSSAAEDLNSLAAMRTTGGSLTERSGGAAVHPLLQLQQQQAALLGNATPAAAAAGTGSAGGAGAPGAVRSSHTSYTGSERPTPSTPPAAAQAEASYTSANGPAMAGPVLVTLASAAFHTPADSRSSILSLPQPQNSEASTAGPPGADAGGPLVAASSGSYPLDAAAGGSLTQQQAPGPNTSGAASTSQPSASQPVPPAVQSGPSGQSLNQQSSQGIERDVASIQARMRQEFMQMPDAVRKRVAALLRMHVLNSVREKVEAGHLDFINEIRPLTCMFLGFPSLLEPRDDVAHQDQVDAVQFAYTSVQAVMRKWDGSFLQFRADEKGFVGICAFGLPGHTHEDNPSRGIYAALELHKVVSDGGHRVSIGVTTGHLLCTCVGARKLRSEYTVFGDAINLSARLMCKAKKDPAVGDILCDEATYIPSKYKASFEELAPLPVKGKAMPVQVYRVAPHDGADAKAKPPTDGHSDLSAASERPLIGRDAELTLILNKAANMISGMAPGGTVVVEGGTGMGKTKLLNEVRKSLERIGEDTSFGGKPAFHMVLGVADTTNRNQKLHPWRRVFQELFQLDLNRGFHKPGALSRKRSTAPAPDEAGGAGAAAFTLLGERLGKVPQYEPEWRRHLAELLDLPLATIPLGLGEDSGGNTATSGGANMAFNAEGLFTADSFVPGAGGREGPGPVMEAGGDMLKGVDLAAVNPNASAPGPSMMDRWSHDRSQSARDRQTGVSNATLTGRAAGLWKQASMRHQSSTSTATSPAAAGGPPILHENRPSHINANGTPGGGSVLSPGGLSGGGAPSTASPASATGAPGGGGGLSGGGAGGAVSNGGAPGGGTGTSPGAAGQVNSPIKKNSLNFLVHVLQEFISLYGPTLILLENLHDFDTWSWQLLIKVSEVLTTDCLVLATTRPNDMAPTGPSHLHGKAALYQKVAMMYRHLLKQPSTMRIMLDSFNFMQTKSLMQVVADINYPEQYVLAVMEKTGGMPLYIEKVTEFLCQKPWLADQGGEFAANVNKMIRNLNFQQVIIERMDRLKPSIHLTLKVASVMGQWVDLDILHKFYPITKSKEELKGHLVELERGNFLKPTDADGVWEFNMVERDIVYEVIPHYQRRRLHAKLAQELEKSLEEQHVATLTTIAYHWNQACMGHEVTEVECSLKAIEFWHRAAEAAYSGSSLMEALKLYQKAAQIAEVVSESMGGSMDGHKRDPAGRTGQGMASSTGHGHDSATGNAGNAHSHAEQSFTAVGPAFKGTLSWHVISRISRAQWEKSMASCCLGIVLQHRYEFNNQIEYWDTEDYFTLLTEHAIRGLMLLGAPHPKELLHTPERRSLFERLCCGAKEKRAGAAQAGLVLQEDEVAEVRDILLVLIIAAEHYSLHHDSEEYTRLLTFCKRVCTYFASAADTGTDPFVDIRAACTTRIRNFRATRVVNTHMEFGVGAEPQVEAATARERSTIVGPELSRTVLGTGGGGGGGGLRAASGPNQ